MHEILDEAQQAANPFLVDGAARTKEFVPQHADPSDDAGGPVPDEVWASDEFQDNLYAWTRVRFLSCFPTCVAAATFFCDISAAS